MTFKAAVCPSCGGELQVPDNRDSVKCMYCGTDIIVREAIQAVSGVNIQNYLQLAATAIGAKNYQEAYDYYSKVLEVDINNSEAWFGRATAAGRLATFAEPRFGDIQSGFENAIKLAAEGDRQNLKTHAAGTIWEIETGYYNLMYDHVTQFASVAGVWETYLFRCKSLLSLLQFGHRLDPYNRNIMQLAIHVCTINQQGITFQTSDDKNVKRLSPGDAVGCNDIIKTYTAELQQIDPDFKPPGVHRAWSGEDIKYLCCIVVGIFLLFVYMSSQ